MKRTFQNVIILVSLLALFVLLCGCEEDRRVNVEYNICSRLYRCDSEFMDPLATPVCFVMPDHHGDMIITFHTTEVFGFSDSFGNAVASNDYLQPFGVDYTNDGLFDVIDLALSASAAGLEVTTLYYSDDNDVLLDLAKSITGYQIGHYYFSALDYDNNVTCQGMIPEGKSTMFLSSNIKEVRIYSYIDPGLNNYWKSSPVPGNVAYESAYEIDTTTPEKDAVGNDIDSAIEAYKLFVAQKHHEDEWEYDIDGFALYDLNNDRTPELFVLGGGRMDYCKIFTYKEGAVKYVHWGSDFSVYDNGLIYYGFGSGDGYTLHSLYKINNNLEMELVFRYAEWYTDGISYSIGETAYEPDSERVPYERIQEKMSELTEGASEVTINYHDTNDTSAWNID